jgi:hypothetical protein
MNALCAAHDHDLDVGGTLWRAGLWIKLWKTRYLSVDINHCVQPLQESKQLYGCKACRSFGMSKERQRESCDRYVFRHRAHRKHMYLSNFH